MGRLWRTAWLAGVGPLWFCGSVVLVSRQVTLSFHEGRKGEEMVEEARGGKPGTMQEIAIDFNLQQTVVETSNSELPALNKSELIYSKYAYVKKCSEFCKYFIEDICHLNPVFL